MQIHIGCSGFYNRHWKGVFYPEGLRPKDWFSYYAKHLNTLEINTTFYKFPTAEKLRIWFDQSPDNFRFTVKAPRLITHFKKLNDCEAQLLDFLTACTQGLGHKLQCILFQFPPQFDYTPHRLDLVRKNLQSAYFNVAEFRHTSWWAPSIIDQLGEAGIIFCSPDHPSMPQQLIINQSVAYVRWHGNPHLFYSSYTEEQMKKLLDELQQHTHLQEAFIYFNNTAGIAGISNALELTSMVQGTARAPHFLYYI